MLRSLKRTLTLWRTMVLWSSTILVLEPTICTKNSEILPWTPLLASYMLNCLPSIVSANHPSRLSAPPSSPLLTPSASTSSNSMYLINHLYLIRSYSHLHSTVIHPYLILFSNYLCLLLFDFDRTLNCKSRLFTVSTSLLTSASNQLSRLCALPLSFKLRDCWLNSKSSSYISLFFICCIFCVLYNLFC